MDQVQQIKDKLNIVDVLSGYLRLEKAGVNFKTLCPFHNEKTPSFMVSPSRQAWYCFGCSLGGDIFTFVQKIEGVEFPEALKTLADKAGIRLEREDPRLRSERLRLYEVCEKAAQFFTLTLRNPNLQIHPNDTNENPILSYLHKRGLMDETIEDWRVGYAPDSWDSLLNHLKLKGFRELEIEKTGLIIKRGPTQTATRTNAENFPRESAYNQYESAFTRYHDRFRNRLMFPIFDMSGRPVGFSGRLLHELIPSRTEKEDSGKYINSPETVLYNKGKLLYGLDKAKSDIRKAGFAVLVEGQFDAILPAQDGAKNIVATSGTALTEEHLEILKRLCDRLILAFDMDEAGSRATKRGIDLALLAGFDVKVLNIGFGKDPADFVKENPGKFSEILSQSKPLMDYYFEDALGKFDSGTLEGKKFIAVTLLSEIKRLPSAIERSHWIRELALKLNVAEKDLEDEMRHIILNADQSQSAHESRTFKPNKSRKEILSERLLAHIIKSPDCLECLADVAAFLAPHDFTIASAMAKTSGANYSNLRMALPQDLRPRLDYLLLLADYESAKAGGNFNAKSETELLARELAREHWREAQAKLMEKIKKAESTRDSELDNLMKEFQGVAKELHKSHNT